MRRSWGGTLCAAVSANETIAAARATIAAAAIRMRHGTTLRQAFGS